MKAINNLQEAKETLIDIAVIESNFDDYMNKVEDVIEIIEFQNLAAEDIDEDDADFEAVVSLYSEFQITEDLAYDVWKEVLTDYHTNWKE